MKLMLLTANEITLGEAKQANIGGVAGAFPSSLENSLGFRLGGLVSHSFFGPYRLTLDFINMRLRLEEN